MNVIWNTLKTRVTVICRCENYATRNEGKTGSYFTPKELQTSSEGNPKGEKRKLKQVDLKIYTGWAFEEEKPSSSDRYSFNQKC